MGQGIQFANSNQLPEVSEIADSQQTAEGSQFTDSVQLPIDLQMELSPIPRPSGVESNGFAPDSHHFELDSEDHSQDLPASQESKASSHSRAFGIGCHSSKDRYLASLKHSATRTNETCSKLSVEAQQGHVYDMPPPVSSDTMFQLELSSLESLDEILIPEGVDVSRCSWDETTNADLDVLVKALKYSDCVQNEVFWRIGRFICKSSSKSTLRDEKAADLAKRLQEKKVEEYQHLLALCGCDRCRSVDPERPIEGLHCCRIDSRARNLNDRFTNTSKRSLVRMAAIAADLGPAPHKLGYTRLTMSPSMFLETAHNFLPRFLNDIAIGSSLPVPDVLMYDFPPDDQCRWVDVPLDKIFFPDADGLVVDRFEDPLFVQLFGSPKANFRFEGIDAPEMNTAIRYLKGKGDRRSTWEACVGHNSLRYLRRILDSASCDKVRIIPRLDSQGRIDKGFYGRFIVRVLFKEHGSASWADLGEKLLLRGMAFVYPVFGIPNRYARATRTAQDKHLGLFEHPKEVLRAILPWECRERNRADKERAEKSEEDGESGECRDGEKRAARKEGKTVDIMLDAPNQHGTMCRISCPRGLPNELLAMERNLRVGISGLEGAGEGLFLEPQEKEVPKGTRLCLYLDKLVNLESPSSSGDYSISVAVNAVTGIADAEECHDIFFGPKCNDKSFVDTILSIDYNVPQGRSTRGISTLNPTSLDSMFSLRKKYQASSSNCKFSIFPPYTFVETTKPIPAHTRTELFVPYGLHEYWVTKLQKALKAGPNFANGFEEQLHNIAVKLKNCSATSEVCRKAFAS